MIKYSRRKNILGVYVYNYSLNEILEILSTKLNYYNKKSGKIYNKKVKKRQVFPLFTINPEIVVLARTYPYFRKVLNRSFLSVPDGIGIIIYSLLKGKKIRERITGIDLVYAFCRLSNQYNLRVGFLGGKDTAALLTMQKIKKIYPSLSCWAEKGPYVTWRKDMIDSDTQKNQIKLSKHIIIHQKMHDFQKLIKKIMGSHIVFVAFGAPKQELFIDYIVQNYKRHNKPLILIGVGGVFDELSGKVLPTPYWIEKIGGKWLFRLITQPWRWKRQLRLISFIRYMFVK